MFNLDVWIRDFGGSARLNVWSFGLDIDSIKDAIESKYKEWTKALKHDAFSSISVTRYGKPLAEGSVIWWANGTHSYNLRLTS